MANSLVIDWLNENALRAFPLKETISRVSGAYTLTNDVILDAQFSYETLPSEVELLSIVADATNVVFTCTGSITFTAPRASTYPLSIRTAQGHLLTIGDVTGIDDGTYTFTNVVFEPSVSHEFGAEWLGVQSLSFNAASYTGDLNFIEGYQFDVLIDGVNITFGAGNKYGIPVACEQFGSLEYDCDSIVSYINGVGPDGKGIVRLINGGGIVVLDDPENHRIFVGMITNGGGDVCRDIPINPAL